MWMRSSKTFNTHWKKLGKSKFGFERTVVSKFKSKRCVGSGNELVDYSRAPCLGADQKASGLWGRDWLRIRNEFSAHAPKTRPFLNVAILGADQKKHSLWGREWLSGA